MYGAYETRGVRGYPPGGEDVSVPPPPKLIIASQIFSLAHLSSLHHSSTETTMVLTTTTMRMERTAERSKGGLGVNFRRG
jgi:hypothetical protein